MTNNPKPHKAHGDSVEGLQDAMASVQQPTIQPPPYVRVPESALPYWKAIVCARARETWTDADLIMAGNLARSLAKIEKLDAQMDEEGDVLANKKGTPCENPKHRIIETLTRRSVAIMGKLQIHAAATVGDKRDAHAALAQERAARAVLEDAKNLPAGSFGDLGDLIPTRKTAH